MLIYNIDPCNCVYFCDVLIFIAVIEMSFCSCLYTLIFSASVWELKSHVNLVLI